jgi:hypothetical protein
MGYSRVECKIGSEKSRACNLLRMDEFVLFDYTTMRGDFFLDLLDEHYPHEEAEERVYLPEPEAGVGDESA